MFMAVLRNGSRGRKIRKIKILFFADGEESGTRVGVMGWVFSFDGSRGSVREVVALPTSIVIPASGATLQA